MTVSIATNKIIYREDLYPRSLTNPKQVQEYAENLDMLPPIEINQNNILIDGWHRWTAHKKNEIENINAVVVNTETEAELFELAINKNAAHGLQLSMDDKRTCARKIYNTTPDNEKSKKKIELASLFSVSERVMFNWLSRIDKDTKAAQKKTILDLWMQCYTQVEISEKTAVPRKTICDVLAKNAEMQFSPKSDFSDENFKPPIYNIWKTQNKSNTSSHPGNTEQQWFDNLLYIYTKPFDIVVDPFAGGGSTIDVCRKRQRRFFVSDRKPIVERESEIRRHDITDGLPNVPRWKDVKLVFLDPPYWKQAENLYSKDPEDLGNMTLEDFNKNLSAIICKFSKKIDGYIALVIQPTQWKAPEKKFTDHVGDMLRLVKLPVDMRYSVPYESQQCTPQMVDWSKKNRRCLVLTREIIVWRTK